VSEEHSTHRTEPEERHAEALGHIRYSVLVKGSQCKTMPYLPCRICGNVEPLL